MEFIKGANLVVIERGFQGGQGSRALGDQNSVVRYKLDLHDIKYIEPTGSQLKKFVLGKGQGVDKALMLREVWRLWGIDAVNNDEADAAGLAKIGWAYAAGPEYMSDLAAHQRAVIEALRYPKKRKRRLRK
jgi:Holliday junction resolvasome RuvABC endonuclease subunit